MGQYLKLFETHENYEDFIHYEEMLRPNVSHCITENEVHYNPWFQDIKKINNYNIPFITSSSNNQFFSNPFTITMMSSLNENSATVKTYNFPNIDFDDWDGTTPDPDPQGLIETVTATSNDGINWTCNLNNTYYKINSYVITITFNETTYKTYYKHDGK